ncbi:MAG TPA: hypothetical protein VKB80_04700 [Kofleriaceae bacterium]|nr:hypothetical protein [Kofleriaceae bacterium]
MRVWNSVGLGLGLAVGLGVALAGCKPSATVQRTVPLANLHSYRGVVVRATGRSHRRAGRLAFLLEHAAADKIRSRCAFSDVQAASDGPRDAPADLFLDVTVQRTYRGGGGGIIQNENQATVEVKLVLSDGVDEELVGAADIQGKSGGFIINNRSPEEEAIGAVADTIATMLARSGCTGPRVARARPPARRRPPPGDDGNVELVSERRTDVVAKAEAENDEGKRLFRSADVTGAKLHFQAAIRLHRDARYVFNMCLAEEALGRFDAAVTTCRQVIAMKPEPALADKARTRLDILAQKQK